MRFMNRYMVNKLIAISLVMSLIYAWWVSYLEIGLQSSFVISLVSAGIFFSLGAPWKFTKNNKLNIRYLLLATILLVLGISTQILVIFSIGWVLLLWAWLNLQLDDIRCREIAYLLPLALLSFPWIEMDFNLLSSSIRENATSTAAEFLDYFDILQSKTNMTLGVAGQKVFISPECDGRDTLQSMLVIGFSIASCSPIRFKTAWILTPIFCLLAWLSNVIRIILISIGICSFNGYSDSLIVHQITEHSSIAVMLLLCFLLFRWLPKYPNQDERECYKICKKEVEHVTMRSTFFEPLMLVVLLAISITLGINSQSNKQISNILSNVKKQGEQLSLLPIDLSEEDLSLLGNAKAVRFQFKVNSHALSITVVDGTNNRHAVHDPSYCWTVLNRERIPVSNGYVVALTVIDAGRTRNVLYWYWDGEKRHASTGWYVLQSSLQRVSGGKLSIEPALILIEPAGQGELNWYDVLDSFPFKEVI
ncbi:MAG: hypothetical protein COA78_06060 [Blastopirellula sp.]|nr:MAG: hypothetical protein COA78_06060 [Blastopirellula sp.]